MSILAILFALIPLNIELKDIRAVPQGRDLDAILSECAVYCEKLANSVLDFVCEERIREEIHHYHWTMATRSPEVVIEGAGGTMVLASSGRRDENNEYVYDYQLVRRFHRIDERRVLLRENGDKKNEKGARLKTQRFKYNSIILGPIGLLSEFWQKHYDYRIVGRKKFRGDRAILVEAAPKPNMQPDYLYGRIWIKEDDCSVVKIEWTPKSIGQFQIVEDEADKLNAEPVVNIYAEYAFEKNGVRFPSKIYFSEDLKFKDRSYRRRRQKYARSNTTITYKKYRFFTVETEVKH